MKKLIRSALDAAGFEVRRKVAKNGAMNTISMPVELTEEEGRLVSHVKGNNLSMASYERLWATVMACKHAIEAGVEGDFVECGVWRGGNALLAASVIKSLGSARRVYLFDTFEGMTAPSAVDQTASDGVSAMDKFLRSRNQSHNEWCFASLEDVRNNFQQAGLLNDSIVFVKGDVENTLTHAANLPDKIAVLRLDTDWYESTRKELEVLYPRLSVGGALIIDDYGHWAGARKATDEYFVKHGNRPFLQYSDYTGRLGIKLAS